ncbi:hypothetical protein B0H67DRAFT_571415 [Lasiosphaeris hirsuta]|uniref:Response regulatory domain-containing protein n=1 Tax=Lasiosphaeris hirsuta TaxID=260670 RepID=A0AA40E7Y5_9PEZI|nr:hypothetical protein B0H67DRAFT_571415 [Lasiosphaeris hirsuta]
MGDLRSKLRAKFPRRSSGVPLLITTAAGKTSSLGRSEKSDGSETVSGSETASNHRPSECVGNGHPSSLLSFEHGEAPEPPEIPSGDARSSHSSRAQATPLTTANEPRDKQDRLRQAEGKQETRLAAASTGLTTDLTTDVRPGWQDQDTINGSNGAPRLASSAQPQPSTIAAILTTATSPTPPVDRTDDSTKNATDSGQFDGDMHPANAQPPVARTQAPGSEGPNANGNDQRVPIAKLCRINEYSSENLSSINDTSTHDFRVGKSTAGLPPLSVSVANAASDDPSPTSTAAPAELPLRRIRLDDSPNTFPATPAAPTTTAAPAATTTTTTTTTTTSLTPSNSLKLRHSYSLNTTPRRQSLLPSRQTTLIRTLLGTAHADELDPATAELLPISANMVTRKIWVKRSGASATLVTINEEDLVDDVRGMILLKYSNSLGRVFDAPDLTLRIIPREQNQERTLGPEEPMARTLDAYFPGGQTVDEALIIEIPQRRTPRPSPRAGPPHAQHLTSVYFEETRPVEAGTDYFGPGAVPNTLPTASAPIPNGTAHPHAMSVISTGQVPQIPSPGGTRSRPYRERPDRPRLGRQHTSSPTVIVGAGGHPAAIAAVTNHGMHQIHLKQPRSRTHSNASEHSANGPIAPAAPLLPTPPAQEPIPIPVPRSATPPPRTASPRPTTLRSKKKKASDHPALPAVMLNGVLSGVPPINVLIVEDNIINLRLLEAFVKRLKVRWQTAMNGREAVDKWRAGGFHLVLMDIQLPVMSGLEATREIRRLERMNSIGAFSSSPASSSASAVAPGGKGESDITAEEDKLNNRELFKSPVIIVALTASSLQSDRHEALAAGCNDFLTKPVTYVWLERKVMEWGCMQALIDYDGWRKWKEYTQDGDDKKSKAKKNRLSQTSAVEAR